MVYWVFLLSLIAMAETPGMGVEAQLTAAVWATKPTGKPEEKNLKGQVRIDGFVDITPEGWKPNCLQIKGRISSGEKFNNETFNTGIGTQEEDFSLSLRQLYVSSSCLKDIMIEAGSVAPRGFGTMGLSPYGALDGVQVVIKDEDHGREYIVSAGQVSEATNLPDRDFKELNHLSAQVSQKIRGDLTVFGSIARYNGEIFNRAGVLWALGAYRDWLTETGLEVIAGDGKFLGTMGHVRLKVKNWNLRVAAAHIDEVVSPSDKQAFQMKQFYGYGNNFYLEASKVLGHDFTFNARLRLGDAGPLIQAGFTRKLGIQTKKVKP